MSDLFDDLEVGGLNSAASGADFSSDSVYRYALWRVWQPASETGNVAVFGLNPSTAAEVVNDMTITKGIGFAKRWGHGGLYMFNPYAFVSTQPGNLILCDDPVGPRNDSSIAEYLANCNITRVVVAWGAVPTRWRPRLRWQTRIDEVLRIVNRPVFCLGRTQGGDPRHPSRIGYDTPLELWRPVNEPR